MKPIISFNLSDDVVDEYTQGACLDLALVLSFYFSDGTISSDIYEMVRINDNGILLLPRTGKLILL